MIGILIPVHNEEQLLDLCLETIKQAAEHPDLKGERVEVLVVLDSCTDSSADIARAHGVMVLRSRPVTSDRHAPKEQLFSSTEVRAGWPAPMATAPWRMTGLPSNWHWMPMRYAGPSCPAIGTRISLRLRRRLTSSITSTGTAIGTFMVPTWVSAQLPISVQAGFRHWPATKTCIWFASWS